MIYRVKKIKMKFVVLSTLIAAYKASDVYTPLETNLLNTIENLLNGFVDTEYNLARKYRKTMISGKIVNLGIYDIMDTNIVSASQELEKVYELRNDRLQNSRR